MRRIATYIGLLAITVACGQGSGAAAVSGPAAGGSPNLQPDTVTAVVGSTFNLRLGQTARFNSQGPLVTFTDVREDSRCPVGTQCATAGNAQIALNTRTPEGATGQTVLNLTATQQFPSTVSIAGIELRFQGLAPSPQANRTIPRDQYVATFVSSRP